MHSSLRAPRGWTADLLRSGPDFRRWAITGPETVLVDLAVDSPSTGTPTLTIAGPALDPADLVVRKTLALFGRAEPRDYIDIYVLNQRFNREDSLGRAAEADQGFNQDVFAQALRAHRRIRDADFPDIGTPIEEIRTYFDSWADELDGRLTSGLVTAGSSIKSVRLRLLRPRGHA